MSSRASRRSCSNTNQLNKCTIPLMDKKRLVKELQERNLDTSGTQPDLADRLLAFLDGTLVSTAAAPGLERAPSEEVATPKPTSKKTPAKKTPATTPKAKTPAVAKSTPKDRKKPVKEIKQEPEDVEEEVAQEGESNEVVTPSIPKAKVNGKISVKEEPPEEVEQEEGSSEPAAPANRRSSRKQNKENNTPAAKKKEPKKRQAVVKVEPPEEPEDVPSTSAEPVAAAQEQNHSGAGDERRSRRKSARLLASEQMEVDEPTTEEEPEPEPAAGLEPEPELMETGSVDTEDEGEKEPKKQNSNSDAPVKANKSEKAHKSEKEKKIRIKIESDSDEDYGKGPQASSSDDPDFDVARHSKRIKEHHDSLEGHYHKPEKAEKPAKIRHSTSSTSAPAPPPKQRQADWQLEWAKKMAEHKKTAVVPEKKVVAEVKRKESGEKGDASKKKKVDGAGAGPLEKIDAITALMSSSIVKKDKEKIEKRISIDIPARIGGGSDATSISEYGHPYSRGSSSSAQAMPMASPQSAKQYPTGTFFNQSVPIPTMHPIPPMPYPPMLPMPVGMPILPPPPPPAVNKRRSRFDQPPADFTQNFQPKANAPPPTLATTLKISRRSPPPPPPPPRKKDDIPPPPPKPAPQQLPAVSTATTELQRRVQELFSGESSSPVPVVFSPSQHDSVPPPPPPRPKPVENSAPVKRPLVKEEVHSAEEDDDDEFVIRDTVVETRDASEPAPKLMKIERRETPVSVESSAPIAPVAVKMQELSAPIAPEVPAANLYVEEEAPRAINKVEEQRKKEAKAEERRRRAMELGDGEYDPMETTGNDESTLVYDYNPTNAVDEPYEETDDELLGGETEEEEEGDEEGDGQGEEEQEDEALEEEEDETVHDRGSQSEDEEGRINITHDGKDLLKLLNTASEQKKNQYMQLANDIPSESLLTRHEDEKPEEVYYHGEPVPEIDENELYEIAAGIKPKKKEKKALVQIPEEERLPTDAETIELDYYNADIHVKSAEKNIWQIEPFCQDGLALMWGGVRSNFGIKLPFKKSEKDKAKRLGFQIQVDAYQSIQHLPTEFMSDGGDVRIGFSLGSAPLVLGEYSGSWCISASGKQANNNYFAEFGHSFDIGDVVTCILDLEEESISYLINGKDCGTPFKKIAVKNGDLIFPTICTKNANLSVNLGQELSDEKWKIDEDRDWMFITEMDRAHLIRSHVAPESKKDCTVLMTVGLPGVGKTTWVRRYLAEHPHEYWTLISADVVMDAMKINGVPRIRLPSLKRPDFLRGIIGKSMARLILLAPRRRKNYILDMTNCFAEKRKRKLMAFEEFNRKCMIFVPDEHEHQNRLIKQEHEENEKLDTDALMQHKAATSLPSIENGEPCEELIFIEPAAPNEHLAFERVSKMNYDCRSWLVVPGRRRGGGFHSHGHGGGHHGNRGYHNDNYGGGYQQQQNFNRPSTSGSSGQNQYGYSSNSPRAMNITHTTFQSNTSQHVAPSPRVRFADEAGSTPASAFAAPPPVQIEPIVLPPVHIKPQMTSAQASPVVQNNFSFPPTPQTKVEVSQPLTLNTSQAPRKFESPAPLSSGGRSSFSANSPRFAFTPKESSASLTPVAPVTPSSVSIVPQISVAIPTTSVPPLIAQPSPMLMSQPPPPVGTLPPVHLPPPMMFPIDVTVPPPNFATPPPPLPGVLPTPPMMFPHQMSIPPPSPQTFAYPPPQFAPR